MTASVRGPCSFRWRRSPSRGWCWPASPGRWGPTWRGRARRWRRWPSSFGDDRWLLILDNLEQVVEAARDLDELLARCPGVVILATSRTVLGLRAEREYPVPPLPLPADPAAVPVEELAASPAVALFVDRARAVRPGFALTAGNAAAVAEICRRLEGLPLAIELAAARTRLLDPDALLGRLARSLDALGTGAVDLPERQRTLRATVEWSVGLLEDAERSLLEVVAVFVDGWTVEAAAQVAGLDEDRVLDLTEALARHSLIYLDPPATAPGRGCWRPSALSWPSGWRPGPTPPRFSAGTPTTTGRWPSRPTGRCAAPASASGASGWRPRKAIWPPPCAGTSATTPGRCPTCSGSCGSSGSCGTIWARPAPGSASCCPPPAPSTSRPGPNCVDGGGDRPSRWATTKRRWRPAERLAPLLDGIEDPYLRAVSQLVMAWTSAIVGDFDSALREALVALEQLRGQDEPFWTALAALHRRPRGDDRRPLRRRPAPPDRDARPGGAVRQPLAGRRLPGVSGHRWPSRRAGRRRPAGCWMRGWS